MTENEVTVMLAEAIDQDKEYKSWHVSTKHLMTFAKLVAAVERERIKQANAPEIKKINSYIEHAMSEVQRLGQEIEQEPVAHCKVRPLRGDKSFPKVEIDWVNQPVPGPLYTSPPQRTEQEPVLLFQSHRDGFWCVDLTCAKCYSADFRLKHTSPPQRKPLTHEEINAIWNSLIATPDYSREMIARAIEAAHGIKENT